MGGYPQAENSAVAPTIPVCSTPDDIIKQAVDMGVLPKSATKHLPQEKPLCLTCKGDCAKVLRCSVCKTATYCSAQCQKEDWKFHKRLCKKWKPPVTCWCGDEFADDVFYCKVCGTKRPDEGKPENPEDTDDDDNNDGQPQRQEKAPKAAAPPEDSDEKNIGDF